MSVMPREDDDASDLRRRAEAERGALMARLNALANAPIGANSRDRKEVLALRASLRGGYTPTQKEVERIAAFAWKWRRHMPRDLAPRLNPADPIVRDLERADVR